VGAACLFWSLSIALFFGHSCLVKNHSPSNIEEPEPVAEEARKGVWGNIKEVLTLVWKLLRRPAFMCIILTLAAEGLLTPMAQFTPKFIERQYQFQPFEAGLSFAALIILPGFFGPITGFLIKIIV
jgi:hypothetical protein